MSSSRPNEQRTYDDLSASGLTKRDASKLGIVPLEPGEVRRFSWNEETNTYWEVPGYYIPYYDLDGEATDFGRLKLFHPPSEDDLRRPKYFQQAGSGVHAYFPPTVSWQKIAKDPKTTLTITEGEKKTAVLCKHKIPCLGIGGVTAWRTQQFGSPYLKEFDAFEWSGRRVFVVFDADLAHNGDVIKALTSLCTYLTKLGARIKVVYIPADTVCGPKAGVDDYIKEFGIDAYKKLLAQSDEFQLSGALWALNERYALIEDQHAIYDVQWNVYRSKSQFDLATAPLILEISNGKKKTGGNEVSDTKIIKVGEEWLKWEHRRTHPKIAFEPGQPEILEDMSLNTWQGWGTQPVLGNLDPFLAVFDYLTKELKEDEKHWLWQWFAYPIQNPGIKIQSAVLFYSKFEGTGKSSIGEVIAEIYGRPHHAAVLDDQDRLFHNFNAILKNKQFICGNEIAVDRREMNRLKNIVTQPDGVIEQKGIDARFEIDRCNWMLTTNNPDALHLSKTDRRWMVIALHAKPLKISYYKSFRNWMAQGGANFLHYHLLKEVDCRHFNPGAPPPVTDAKNEMRAMGASGIEEWCEELRRSPEDALTVGAVESKYDLFTLRDIRSMLPDELAHTTSKALRKALIEAGFQKPRDRCTHPEVRTEKSLWIIRNDLKWTNIETGRVWMDHYVEYVREIRDPLNVLKDKAVRKF